MPLCCRRSISVTRVPWLNGNCSSNFNYTSAVWWLLAALQLNVWWPRTLSICLFVCSSFRSRLEALFSGNSIIRSCSKKTCKYRNKVTDFIEITREMDANKVLDFVLLVHLWMPRGLASVRFLYYNGHPWHFSLQRIPNTPFSTINDLLTRRKFYCCNKVIFILL